MLRFGKIVVFAVVGDGTFENVVVSVPSVVVGASVVVLVCTEIEDSAGSSVVVSVVDVGSRVDTEIVINLVISVVEG